MKDKKEEKDEIRDLKKQKFFPPFFSLFIYGCFLFRLCFLSMKIG